MSRSDFRLLFVCCIIVPNVFGLACLIAAGVSSALGTYMPAIIVAGVCLMFLGMSGSKIVHLLRGFGDRIIELEKRPVEKEPKTGLPRMPPRQ